VPLWAGVASREQASRVVEHLPAFEYDHGLVACEAGWLDETEHNFPTGWPYSHWYVCKGLRDYGYHDDASRIALKWLRLIASEFVANGASRERYNVVEPSAPVPGLYPPQRGFAWTNGTFAALLVRIIFGIEARGDDHEVEVNPTFPADWSGERVEVDLPNYPWPQGLRECFAA
jgi:alpha,alpha-trehalase